MWYKTYLIKAATKKGYPSWKVFKKNKVKLTPEERKKVMDEKAVWHRGPNGEETAAVSKAIVDGKPWYETHTHRALNVRPSLKGAISQYHKVIKGTA